MDKKNIDYFLICHDQNLILEYINTNKFQYLPNIIFLFVGNSQHDLIDNLSNVIICKNLKYNIEKYPDLCAFTAWYAIEYNQLSSSEYICLLEYDIDIENNFHNKNIEYLKNNYFIYGYFESLINLDMFRKSTPWIDIILKYYYDFELDYFIQSYCNPESYWHPTTNILIEKNTFSKYVRWFYNLCDMFANNELGSYVHERMLAIYSHMNKIKTHTITNTLTHKQLCSHKNKDLIESKIDYTHSLKEMAWLIPIDIDFDYNFYYNKYPDIQKWYFEDKIHSLKQKMFHHYFLYGKTEKRLKNNNIYNNLINKKTYNDFLKIASSNKENKNYFLKKGVSIVCAVKNRIKPLLVSLNSWLLIPEVKNIIIVDYSSDDPIEPHIKNISNKIKVIRIQNEKYFNISKAYNIGFKKAPDGYILKMDCDYIMNPYFNFFDIYNIKEREFLTGNWKDNKLDNGIGFIQYLNGLLFISREDLLSVGGYDESFEGYGFDDCDLYERLEKKGMIRKYLDHDFLSVFHIPHDNFHRTENYKNKNLEQSLSKNEFISNSKKNKLKILIITLFNETNKNRIYEYYRCLSINLQSLEFSKVIVLFEDYEKYYKNKKSLMLKAIELLKKKYPSKLIIQNIDSRPSYNDIFNFVNTNLDDQLVVFANADIYFDNSLSKLDKINFQNNFIILTRYEDKALITQDDNGLPNYLSADVWIFKTPLKQDFRADYTVGTFFCDSFLNNQLYSSKNYNIHNPCLTVKANHLHNITYNSSTIKKLDTSNIKKIWEKEYKLCGEKDPNIGFHWCAIDDISLFKEFYKTPQRYFENNLVINLNKTNSLLNNLFIIQKLLKIDDFYDFKIWINPTNDEKENHAFDLIIKQYIEYLNNPRLSFNTTNSYNKSHVAMDYSKYKNFNELKDEILQSKSTFFIINNLHKSYLESKDIIDFLNYDFNKKWFKKTPQFTPIKKTSQNKKPIISIIASIYKGKKFIEGYLENITSQTIFSDCELILVDANSPDNEKEIVEKFIKEKGFDNIIYLRLEKDLGLYECWNTAIRQSRGKYITNANLDDIRSPLHLEVLLTYIESKTELSAVCSALYVTKEPNKKWSELEFDATETWFEGIPNEINFNDLYNYRNELLISRNILHCMPLWKKELHDKYGYFDEKNYGTSADWEFWLRCSSKGEKFGILDIPLGMYYISPNSHNRQNDKNGLLELDIIKKYFNIDQKEILKQ